MGLPTEYDAPVPSADVNLLDTMSTLLQHSHAYTVEAERCGSRGRVSVSEEEERTT